MKKVLINFFQILGDAFDAVALRGIDEQMEEEIRLDAIWHGRNPDVAVAEMALYLEEVNGGH